MELYRRLTGKMCDSGQIVFGWALAIACAIAASYILPSEVVKWMFIGTVGYAAMLHRKDFMDFTAIVILGAWGLVFWF